MIVAYWGHTVILGLRRAEIPVRTVLVWRARLVSHRRWRWRLVALREARSRWWLGGSLLLVVRGPLLVIVRHTVVVVQMRLVVVRLWLCVAATVIAIRRVVVLAVWLLVLVDRLVAVGERGRGA